MVTHNVLWQVSLETGETYQEGKGKFEELPNELSPWNRLKQYLVDADVRITGLSLFCPQTGQTFHLPSRGKNPKFRLLDSSKIPQSYNFFRAIANEMRVTNTEGKIMEWFSVAEAVYDGYKMQIWVDEKNTRNSWSIVL